MSAITSVGDKQHDQGWNVLDRVSEGPVAHCVEGLGGHLPFGFRLSHRPHPMEFEELGSPDEEDAAYEVNLGNEYVTLRTFPRTIELCLFACPQEARNEEHVGPQTFEMVRKVVVWDPKTEVGTQIDARFLLEQRLRREAAKWVALQKA
ncbi:hypothetical protein BAUCODRAFT_343184 [Baudoinia panamericana UAMH 10762]|uniref:Uncharacterized protein n=1 Tax=Baudoinia panamericana (strain UAMH 10762) TaxID=717646 RepID=M2MS05_BAUPA|nr:uncharacterized protein BAUCODRAFT_343184 [Baudoinia panamericana UAMH 10762]EMC99621.1 hypothetical protein BAUCODRAFT_343184 [Baudoinia panamericana UAMH 10762]